MGIVFASTEDKRHITLEQLDHEDTFKLPNTTGNYIYMVATPAKSFMNSSLLRDIKDRGDIFVFNLSTATFTSMKRTTYVIPVNIKADVEFA